jgi:hypothetical protein
LTFISFEGNTSSLKGALIRHDSFKKRKPLEKLVSLPVRERGGKFRTVSSTYYFLNVNSP